MSGAPGDGGGAGRPGEAAAVETSVGEASANEAPLRVVLCNAPPDQAEGIARAVLEKRLAACVNILPGVVSLYWWQGELCRDAESTLLIKTRADLVAPLTDAIRAAHPYDVPEVIALPLQAGEGNAAYAAWVRSEAAGSPADRSGGGGGGASGGGASPAE